MKAEESSPASLRLRKLLAVPDQGNPERTRKALLLHHTLLAAYPVLLGLTLVAALGNSPVAHITYPLQCAIVFAVLWLIRSRHFLLSVRVLLVSVFGLSTLTIIEEGGAGSAAMGSYAVGVLLAGFFWSFRGALAMVFASVAATAVLVWRPEWFGLSSFTRSDPLRYFGEFSAQILVTALLLQFALEFIRRAEVQRHHAELAALELRNQLERRLQQAQKFEAIGRLAGGVAHDFRNVLTVIIGELELAKEEHPRAELSTARDAAERAVRLASELLAVGRSQELHPVVLDLPQYLRTLEPTLRRLAGPAVVLSVEAPASPCLAFADPGQLERVLVNLVANARDAMPRGGPVAIRLSENDSEVELVVEDRGEGIAPEVMPRVFEPFFSTKGGAGTGLGLAISHGIVTQGGGRLVAESIPGQGTRMLVCLPKSAPAREQVS